MTKLNNLYENLQKSNKRLKEAIKYKTTRMNKDATIQRFEFTFELSWKTIQEYVRDQGFDCKSPKNCVREAVRIGLIENIDIWFEYLKARNFIAHTYDEEMADRIYKRAVKFPKEVDALLKAVQESL